jgi:flagellar biosynthetic protein FliQ
MSTEFVLGLGREAVMLTLLVASPMLVLGLIVGVTVSILQAVTQIQEMTLTFVPKIVAVALAFLVFFPWILTKVVTFASKLFSNLPTMAG